MMEKANDFFEFAAQVGLTKHIGGLEASEELFELCHIGKGNYVLDVGCGAGVTPVLLVKGRNCSVMYRMLSLYRKSAKYREFLRKVKKEGLAPHNLNEYFGYGMYVGRK